MKPIIQKFKRLDLWEFAKLCSENAGVDQTKFFQLAEAAMKYYGSTAVDKQVFRPQQEIETRWYDSVATGKPDYDIYADPYMLVEVWACWVIYSRKYIGLLDKAGQTEQGTLRWALGPVTSIADIGCGCAYTTTAWKQAYPFADVFGTQYPGSAQFKMATKLGDEHGFTILEKLDRNVDLIFASEYFEHWLSPVDHLREILAVGNPKRMIIANAFGSRSVGHFDEYLLNGVPVSPKEISRRFNDEMRRHGFRLLKTKFWNNRPSVWVK